MDGNWAATHGAHHFIGNRWVASAPDRRSMLSIRRTASRSPNRARHRGRHRRRGHCSAARGRRSFDGAWGRMTATERGRLLMNLSAAVPITPTNWRGSNRATTGKPLKQGRADALALARYFEFYGGAADKLHGETIPYQDGYTRADAARAARRHRPHHAVELPDADLRPHRRRARWPSATPACVKPAEDACLSLLRLAELAARSAFRPARSTS